MVQLEVHVGEPVGPSSHASPELTTRSPQVGAVPQPVPQALVVYVPQDVHEQVLPTQP